MERIVSFDEFKRKATEIAEDDSMDGGQEKQHYMFFQIYFFEFNAPFK